ncbi:hypothetical protein SFC50_02510 [Bacillus infantis]|uniref:hypothetical protein n=1 Tax=Bacillus infantis TaxID=324767 RepID=UPI00301A9749
MNETMFLYKFLPILIKSIAIILALVSGYLVYSGISSRVEKQHLRLRFKEEIAKRQNRLKVQAETGKAEEIFKEAGYPLGITGVRWTIIYWILLAFLFINYIAYPYMAKGSISLISIVIIVSVMTLLSPAFPFSLTRFILKRLIEYKKAKRNSELFSLYDMLLSEIEMMQQTRINAYSLIRTLKPYFKELDGTITRLLANWTSDNGPDYALDIFAKEIGTNEAKSLANVLKKFDENKRDTIILSLKGMEDMFINSQIENYRRKRKLYVDLAKLPIKATHGLIILNFVVVIIFMVSYLMKDSKL